MCLKYISFSNTFTIPDENDNNFFKVLDIAWGQEGGPYGQWTDMTIIAFFNRKIDPVSGVKDIDGNFIDRRKEHKFRQFRELFVQEYNKPLEFQNNCFIQYLPLEENCISITDKSGRFWMNSPLKAIDKQQDSVIVK